MSRNSDIARAGMGGRVESLAAAGNNPKAIAAAVSEESGHLISTASVRRHLEKQSVNAAVVSDYSGIKRVVAALKGQPDERDTGQSSYYGLQKLDTTNCFTTYYGLARGLKNGQVLNGFRNIALKLTKGAHLVGATRDEEKITALAESLNFSSLLQNTVRSTCEMGTCLTSQLTEQGAFTTPKILPIEYYSLLTENETVEETDTDILIHGEIDKIIKNEMDDKRKVLERDEIGIIRLWESDNKLKDIHGRWTFGMYGESMTLGLTKPLKSLLNGNYHWDAFLDRYGSGRYLHNLKLLGELVKEKIVTAAKAQEILEGEAAAGQKIGPNQDIFGIGKEVSMLATQTGFDIIPYFQWLEHRIDRTLLQSDVGAGDVGSSWTSAGTAVAAADYDTFESLRKTIFEQFYTEIVVPRCEDIGLNPKHVSIAATPFLSVSVPFDTLTKWVELGHITPEELRDRGGFPEDMPDAD